jgi:hypothetical protein
MDILLKPWLSAPEKLVMPNDTPIADLLPNADRSVKTPRFSK